NSSSRRLRPTEGCMKASANPACDLRCAIPLPLARSTTKGNHASRFVQSSRRAGERRTEGAFGRPGARYMSDPMVSTAWLAARLRDRDVQVVDATWYMPGEEGSGAAEYAAGHVPG